MHCVLCNGKRFKILFPHHNNWNMGKCEACGLVQVVPMPTAKEIAGLYHEDFDHFEPYIDQTRVHHLYFAEKIKEIQKIVIPAKAGIQRKTRWIPDRVGNDRKRFLDIGCATGIFLEEAKKVGWNPVGIDLSADVVAYCKKKKLTAYHGTVYTVRQLKAGTYDVVTAFQVIEHERDPLKMMRRMHSLMKKNGLVVMATPNYGGFWRKVMGKRWFGFTHPEHVVLFDHHSMRLLLEKAEFRDIEVKNDSPRPFPLSFALTRGADYFPWLAWLLRPMGHFFDHFNIKNPINPWDDMIAFGRK